MILISHRGNLSGPRPDLENTVEYVDLALAAGYHVEIDVWLEDERYFLGHDKPETEVSLEYLKNEKFWCHCKNVDALLALLSVGVHCFFHNVDDVTLTSKNYIWTFPNKKLVNGSACVLPELGYNGDLSVCTAVCSDYIEDYR